MYILLVLGIGIACLGGAHIYSKLRPRLGRLRDGLNFLTAHGRDQAEIRFVHTGSDRTIVLRKEIVGGVQQILLVTQRLNLTDGERLKLLEFLESQGLKAEIRRKSKRAKAVNVVILGHSAEKAADVTQKLAREILKFSTFARFKFEFDLERFNLRTKR
jgi:hypothetical protein